MSIDKLQPPTSSDSLCVCIACEKARFGADLWYENRYDSLLNSNVEPTYGLCPVCEKRLHHSLGLMSRLQAF
ncbi:MAG: hypothetical protein OEX12_14740 [Gammaproteobacteria bacterium]|nr:hypothetical protein [Gammaproteobacteria bacterium]